MAIKLIVTDLDGTLLNKEDRINPADKAALLLAQKMGIMVTIATGRPLIEAQEYIDEISAKPYFIGMNGCQTLNLETGQVLNENFLSENTVKEIIALLDNVGAFYEVYTKNDILAPAQRRGGLYLSGLNAHYLDNAKKFVHFVDEIYTYAKQIHKFFIPADSSEIARLLCSELRKREDIAVFNSLENFIEVVPAGCDKIIGLKQICHVCKLEPTEILAIGDSENDLGMLHFAGIGAVMGNAKPEVQEAIPLVVASNEANGVAEAVHIALDLLHNE